MPADRECQALPEELLQEIGTPRTEGQPYGKLPRSRDAQYANQRRGIRARDDQYEADRAPERDQHCSRGGHELLAERLDADPHVAIRVGVQACQVRRHGVHRRACLPNGHVVRQAAR